jgi:flagellar basal-body rod protein FlgC
MFRALEISASGLVAQRIRMDTIAGNIAHVNTTVDENGQPVPFQRRLVVMHAAANPSASSSSSAGIGPGIGVRPEVQLDTLAPPRIVHQPGHPQADDQGNVKYPNINIVTEFVNALEAGRAYEANVTAMELSRDLTQNTFRLLG